ncbi:MAG: hypothetical protein AB7V16_11855 [Vulcanibacillus sp.]
MLNFENKKILISSHNDLDGVFPIILAKRYSQQLGNPDLWMNGYNDSDYNHDELQNYDVVIYPDFSPDEKCRKIIQDNNIICYVLDHHIAVYDELTKWAKTYDKVFYTFSETQSGTEIFYNWLKENFNIETNQTIDEAVILVSTYDTWKKESPLWTEAQNLNRLLYKVLDYKTQGLRKYNLFISIMNHKFDFEDHFYFNKIEMMKINQDIAKEDELFNEIISKPGKTIKTRKDEQGRYFAVIKCNSKVSAICNRLLEKYKKLDYVIALNAFNKEKPSISLRSKQHFNLLELERAKGHEGAAGIENASTEDHENIWSGNMFSIPYRMSENDLSKLI